MAFTGTAMTVFKDLDTSILMFINSFVGRWPVVDDAVRVLADWNFGRGAWLAVFLLWAWFRSAQGDGRLKIVSGLAGVIVATGLSRLAQIMVPFHARPFNFVTEFGLTEARNLDTHWGYASSFPSDTATLYFAVAAIIFSLSRVWGVAAFVWVAAVIALPRVYLLYHWPSDIVAGFALGVAGVALAQRCRHTVPQFGFAVTFERLEPQWFYPLLFLLLYQVVDSFNAVEVTLHELKALSKHMAGTHQAVEHVTGPAANPARL